MQTPRVPGLHELSDQPEIVNFNKGNSEDVQPQTDETPSFKFSYRMHVHRCDARMCRCRMGIILYIR